ncbi:MAG: CPBP family intramembrane metalloprotease [Methanobrevibacter sp.]|jgi:membrane protease YdiL (CAAX protease family)|nr:CPBP family intramembrane metalloprotease [Candidatus Methanoflexus mossambicus]
MSNSFLDNVYQGKNNLWRYVLTIILVIFFQFFFPQIFEIILDVIFILAFHVPKAMLANENSLFSQINLYLLSIPLLIILFVCVKYIHKRDVISVFNASKPLSNKSSILNWFKQFNWLNLLKGMGMFGSLFVVMNTILYLLYPNSFIIGIDLQTLCIYFIPLLILIFIQATSEEVLFRSYLSQGLSLKIKQPIIIILITSLIFGIGHSLNATGLIPVLVYIAMTFITGIILSVAMLVTEGIEFSIGIHLINNFLLSLIFTSGSPQGLIQNLNDGINVPLFNILILLIFAVIMFVWKKNEILKAIFLKKEESIN